MRDAFSRFEKINIGLGANTTAGSNAEASTAEPREDYQFRGFINYHDDHTTTVRFRLLEANSGDVVWNNTIERMVTTRDHDAVENSIVLGAASTLLQPFGVIQSRERVKQLATGEGDPRYRCAVEASESLRTFDPEQHLRARTCLEQLTADAPSFVVGLRYLAAINLREYLFGVGSQPGTISSLNRARREARRAVELRPEGSRAYNTLASVHFASGETKQAFAASERAVRLNKYDMSVQGDFGGRLISAGQFDRGLTLLRQAAGTGSVRPASHHFHLFLANYFKGNMQSASYEADQITSKTYSLGLIAHALAAAAKGERERAGQELARLVTLHPAWRDDTRGQLRKFFPSAEIVDRLSRDLTAAGLPSRP
jgi:tetratricopeptide (TPR) repeat protein